MSPDLITATVLFGPAALLGGAAAVADRRDRPHRRATARVLAELRAARAAGPDDDPDPTPPDGGHPAPADSAPATVVQLAPVIPLPTRTGAPAATARRTA